MSHSVGRGRGGVKYLGGVFQSPKCLNLHEPQHKYRKRCEKWGGGGVGINFSSVVIKTKPE